MSGFIRSFSFALRGIRQCFTRELNFRIHVFVTVIVISAAMLFKVSQTEWFVILLCAGVVMAAELINTAIEVLCNIVHKESHQGIGLVKDMAAGAVLITAVISFITGLVIFLPKIFSLINH